MQAPELGFLTKRGGIAMKKFDRRKFFGFCAGAGLGICAAPSKGERVKIIGIACSPRKGKTTFAGLKVCLEAARSVDQRIETELIELADYQIDGNLAAGVPSKPNVKDDFQKVAARLFDPALGGIIIGTPVYFANMSSLCKAFLDRLIVFRKKGFALRNKVAGVLAVGGARNGGQELAIRSVQAALMCQDLIIVGDGKPTARIGATLWNRGDDVSQDEFGLQTARNLGRRVAELALVMGSSKL